jgi:enamine deaminase RidA (YjgF/YER057c/UK114 family)
MSHAVIQGPGRTVHLSGQVAWDSEFRVVGKGDARAQANAALDNVEKILERLGGTVEDVVSVTMYFVRDEDLKQIQDVRSKRFSSKAGPAVTGVQVSALVDPDLLVEFTIVAVVPEDRLKEAGV